LIGETHHAPERAPLGDPDQRLAPFGQRAGALRKKRRVDPGLGQQLLAAGQQGFAAEPGRDPPARALLKALHLHRPDALLLRAGEDRRGQRVAALGLGGRGQRQELRFPHALRGQKARHRGLALGQRAGLVEDRGAHVVGALQRLGVLEQDAQARALAGARHDRHRRRQAQRAGAGDDQHRDADGQREGGALPGDQPRGHRDQRDRDHHRHEHGADPVGQPSDGRLGGRGLLDQPHDLGEGGLAAPAQHPHAQKTGQVDGARAHLAAGGNVKGHALAGQRRLVDAGLAGHHLAVHRDALAGPDHYHVAWPDVLDGDAPLPAFPDHVRRSRGEARKFPNGVRGPAAGARFEHPAHQHQRDDDRRGFEVNRQRATQNSRHSRVKERRARAGCHQGVHVRRAAE